MKCFFPCRFPYQSINEIRKIYFILPMRWLSIVVTTLTETHKAKWGTLNWRWSLDPKGDDNKGLVSSLYNSTLLWHWKSCTSCPLWTAETILSNITTWAWNYKQISIFLILIWLINYPFPSAHENGHHRNCCLCDAPEVPGGEWELVLTWLDS